MTRLGVVVPTMNEEATLPHLLADLRTIPADIEVVVADGGSEDRTVAVARSAGARVVTTGRGRGRQMNRGAQALDTPWILFLHADSRLPLHTSLALGAWLKRPAACEAAHFTFSLDLPGLKGFLIERGQWLRERLTGLAYGDQGLLLSRKRYAQLGGIPEWPLMEDVEVVRRLRRSGGLARINAPIVTHARRYIDEGPLLTSARNLILITLFSMGIPPGRLADWYRIRGTH